MAVTDQKYDKEIARVIAFLTAAISNMRLYNTDHPQVARYLNRAFNALEQVLASSGDITIIIVEGELIIDQRPLTLQSPHLAQFARLLLDNGVERITFTTRITEAELTRLSGDLAAADDSAVRSTSGIILGKVRVAEAQVLPNTVGNELRQWNELLHQSRNKLKTLFEKIQISKQIELSGFETIVADFITQMAHHGHPLQMLADLKRWDEYTFTHAINVCLLTMAQAEALGISGRKLHDIGIAAAMHDAGKMFVPDEILNKAGKLSEEEWRQMRIHTIRGAMQVLRMEGIPKLAFIGALEHHIRYDGSGYPALGHYRPTLVSQMIAIADMFDAMRSRRPYQEPKPVSLIASILKKDSGTAFHPLLVENFLKLIEPTVSE